MKRIFIGGLCVYALLSALAGRTQGNNPGGKLTLPQCVETGIANNLLVQQSGFQVENSKINWNQAKLNRLPNLNLSGANGINRGKSIDPSTNSYSNKQTTVAGYGLSSGVTLFNGFSLQNSVKQNALDYEASKKEWEQSKNDLTLNIILAYLQVLNNEDQLVQIRNQATLSQKQVERLDILNKDGAIPPSQLSDLRGQYAGEQLSIIDAENALESSKISLSQLMNVPYDKNMSLERLDAIAYTAKYTDTPDSIYQKAMQQFPLIKAVDLRKQSAETGVKVAKGRLFPTLSLNGGINTNYSSRAGNLIFLNTTDVVSSDYVLVNGTPSPVVYKQNNYTTQKISYGSQLNNNQASSISLNLDFPLFNRLQARNQVKLAAVRAKDNAAIAKTTRTQLQQSIDQAYINMNSASEKYKTLLEQVDAYAESFRAAGIRFDAGLGNSIDYLTAKNNLDRANIELISAKYDLALRMKILDYYEGKQLW